MRANDFAATNEQLLLDPSANIAVRSSAPAAEPPVSEEVPPAADPPDLGATGERATVTSAEPVREIEGTADMPPETEVPSAPDQRPVPGANYLAAPLGGPEYFQMNIDSDDPGRSPSPGVCHEWELSQQGALAA